MIDSTNFIFNHIHLHLGALVSLSELLNSKLQATSDGSLVNLSGHEQSLELAVSVARQPVHLLSLVFQFSSSKRLLCCGHLKLLSLHNINQHNKGVQMFRGVRGLGKISAAVATR